MSLTDLSISFNLIQGALKQFTKERIDSFISPQKAKEIKLAEKILQKEFPDSYTKFLTNFGRWSDIYGLTKNNFKNAGFEHVVNATLDQRQLSDLPHHYIIISSTGDGAYYALDTSRMNSKNECPVVLLDDVHGEDPVDVAEDFGEFLLNQLQEALESNK